MESLDPFAVKNKSPYSSSQSPSLNQLQQTLRDPNQWNGGNSSSQYSIHDFDIFLKPSPQSSSAPTNSTQPSFPSFQASPFDPFVDSKFPSNPQTAMQFQSFDPFGPSSAVSSQRSQSNFQDPFAPSFSSAKQHVSSSQGVSFDPFSPFPLQQNHTAPGPVSQFDVDFAFLDQSRPQKQLDVVQKQFSTSEEAIDLDWSNPPVPPLNSTTSGDVDDALEKLRKAYGLSDSVVDDLDGSNHGEDAWPMSPRLPDGQDRHPAPVIGKPPIGRYSHSGASHSPYPVDDKAVVTVADLNLPTEGLLLARLSVRSLVTKDWAPIFWIFSTNHHRRPLHFDEDPLSLLIYRSKDDYEHNPLGTMIKKEIPIRMNLACIPIRRKEYKGYGMLFYFMLEEHTEMGSVPVIKFASANRDDVDVLWINLKARINAAKRKAVKTLVDSRRS